jgi:hypothetical protein
MWFNGVGEAEGVVRAGSLRLVVSINTPGVAVGLVALASQALREEGLLLTYGPFTEEGLLVVMGVAKDAGLQFVSRHTCPLDHFALVFRKASPEALENANLIGDAFDTDTYADLDF